MATGSDGGFENQSASQAQDIRIRAEYAEYEAVLASSTFRRSKALRSILTVICSRYFGNESHTSEYDIAFDALQRKENFNPAVDAIVRVSIYNLRKKLTEFYESEGKDHKLRIQIPPGQYTPEFLTKSETNLYSETDIDTVAPSPPLREEALTPERGDCGTPTEDRQRAKSRLFHRTIILAIGGVAILAVALVWPGFLLKKKTGGPAALSTELHIADSAIRIATGSLFPFQDSQGKFWGSDRWATGGATFSRRNQIIKRASDQRLFQDGREGQFSYDIPLRTGQYELHLYFADTLAHQEGGGTFFLAINGERRTELDIVSDAGGTDTATAKVYLGVRPAADGKLHLVFTPLASPAFLNAIEILPMVMPGKMRPIQQTTQASSYFDPEGSEWLADQWFLGGRIQARSVQVGNTNNPQLFITERYGRFTYAIPVAPHHRYTVTLFFSEVWYRLSQNPHAGLRVFDVSCDGRLLLHNFDILKESGLRNEPVIRSFPHVEPRPEGTIFLSFDPSVDYALINAIQIEDEGAIK